MIRMVVFALLLALAGCGTAIKPLDYKAQRAYGPINVVMPSPQTRRDQSRQFELLTVMRDTGAFSFIDGGFSRTGYTLFIDEPPTEVSALPVILASVTLMTVPVPYSYEYKIRARLFKEGELLKTYSYHRQGMSVIAWYIPLAEPKATREMLDEMMRDLDKDQLIPYQ